MTTLGLIPAEAHPLLHGLIHALGWTLLHFCWQGAIVAGVLWCVLALLGGRSSQARYGAACWALVLIVVAPLMTFARLATAEYKLAQANTGAGNVIDPGIVLWVGAGEPAASWPMRMMMAMDHWVPWILMLWLAGVVMYGVRLNAGLLVAHAMKSRDTHAVADELQRIFDVLRRRLGIARAVRLMHSARVEVPTVIGWLRPVVLIPASCLTGLTAEQIEAIFCHELAHVRRHDYLVSVFQSVVEALLFYHPAVWWVSKQVRRERECCCDEMAVGAGGDVLAYARALSYLEERRAYVPEFVLGANGGVLKMRIKRLLGTREDVAGSPIAAMVLLGVVVALAGSYFVSVARAQSKAAQAAQVAVVASVVPAQAEEADPAQKQMPSVYRAWLEQDVRWIISDAEAQAFKRLTNDEERDKFIEQFWERRNSTQGSAGNSFKDEYYARIAYANQHFASGIPGWKTDRGRFYIVNGKPKSIDAHPSGDPSTLPFEVWHYRAVDGIGHDLDVKFVDSGQNGNYRLVSEGPQGRADTPAFNRPVLVPVRYSPAQTDSPSTAPVGPLGPIRVSSGVIAKNVESQVNPVYPPEAKAKRVQGVVIMHAIISKTGDIENLEVISGPELLRQSAMDAVGQWKYKPYLLNGQPTEVETTINVNYTFGGDGPQPAGAGSAPPEGTPPPVGASAGNVARPVRVSPGVAAGMAISQPPPVYPADAKAARVQGVVVLHAIISKEGTIEDVNVISGPPTLVMSAVDAVRQWKYKPYLLNGEPTEVETTINVNYTLADAPDSKDQGPAADAGMAPRKIGGGVSAPTVIYQATPVYSEQARQAKFSGVVLVNLVVDQQGLPQNVHVLRGVGMGLDESAVAAVRQYRFSPAMEGGKPVPVMLNIEVDYKTENSQGSNRAAANMSSVRMLPDGATAPVIIHQVNPEYTEEARKAKAGGVVLVNLVVDKQGIPQHVHVVRSVGHGLDEKAVDAVKEYRFKPAMKDDQPVEEALNVEVEFRLF
ncbi:MAG TPA: TonB family protein [Acidobacteriaceae bacterium]